MLLVKVSTDGPTELAAVALDQGHRSPYDARANMPSAPRDLFDADSWSPLKVDFWIQPNHWAAIDLGMGANEAEALRHEWLLVQAGERSLMGRPCLCGTSVGGRLEDGIEDWPEAVRGGYSGNHDSMGSIVGLRADLEHAADQLSLPWPATERIFAAMGRQRVWQTRYRRFRMGLPVRRRDRDREPYDFVTGRSLGRRLALAWMASVLGWRGTCGWPRREQATLSARRVLHELSLEPAAA